MTDTNRSFSASSDQGMAYNHESSVYFHGVDLSVAGWFLVVAGIWEILFNRLASAFGLYLNVGATGSLSWLADSGRLAMNASGIMALILACATLPRLAANHRFGGLPARVVLMLASPFYLPIICVAVFRPISAELILFGFLIAAASALLVAILVALGKVDSSSKRVILALGIIQVLGAFELLARVAALFHSSGALEALPRKAYLLAEVLFVVTPFFAFFALKPGRLGAYLRRPHLLGLTSACIAAAVAVFALIYVSDETFFKLIAFRTTGLTIVIPGGAPVYVAALFFGVLLTATLVLPSRNWPPDADSRRTGFGLICIWLSGIQPTHPYQFAMMLVGFIYLARGLLGEDLERAPDSRAQPASS
ncbi:MAG: hypothetical protein GY854_15255 [Deltaproteobacteria bacterium]|nr:hypothetical protein [Deltaproteobacteria bacterium]